MSKQLDYKINNHSSVITKMSVNEQGRPAHVKELSGRIKDMKFMNRANQARIRENLEKEQRIQDQKSAWMLDTIDSLDFKSKVQHEQLSSYMMFIDAPVMARKSFNAFNKNLEKLSLDIEKESRLDKAEENERRELISDKEMTNRYSNLIHRDKKDESRTTAVKRRRDERGDIDADKAILTNETKSSSDGLNATGKLAKQKPVDWSNERGRKATRFAAGQFIKPLE
ncbi:hypothetical protein BATDEDRAFT_86389 [Batrachochytrium dendrobatidis JAM81]|uniref:Uncharacterized protein n=2 Tax=Batrachochytrium dendrobatidis TaxID=109871 RepID=F4NWU1_BATDJ|nr:uncharacterized protein BATDEDRAFT_86389 [Batrachochytrium dendrobatidis JAM81]EGF82879.1 hypothetical protein BATDEDRAFT_86389 [Batrachochytrium dendrobatidis JAM81]OAJ39413.1 hypothetical protein BDEG_23262 [Batrachochytrium dendrobatidis JEL423]|eukprot:XP_006677082.1 hypothetical protein BATDEDRAFT_86389 [Batrachochytrium dendrobatidis JAM81]